jgi:hypothetical protein
MGIVRVAYLSLITNEEKQLCTVNLGYTIVTKQESGDRTKRFVQQEVERDLVWSKKCSSVFSKVARVFQAVFRSWLGEAGH